MHKVFCQFYLEDSSLKSTDVIINICYLMSALFWGLYTSWSRHNLFLALEFSHGDYSICFCFSVQPFSVLIPLLSAPWSSGCVIVWDREINPKVTFAHSCRSSGSILFRSKPLTKNGPIKSDSLLFKCRYYGSHLALIHAKQLHLLRAWGNMVSLCSGELDPSFINSRIMMGFHLKLNLFYFLIFISLIP